MSEQRDGIYGFKEKFGFLSNFFPAEVEYDGISYPTSEHAFQAAKTLDASLRRQISELKTPTSAKAKGKRIPLRSDWEEVKVGIMEDIVFLKFTQHEELRIALLETGNAHLEEVNRHGDRFWGTVSSQGKNMLGVILMKVRDRIKNLS